MNEIFFVFRVRTSLQVSFYIAAILTAGNPDLCGFMADECLLAIPEIEGIDYTTKELINFVEQLKGAANRLNKEGKEVPDSNNVHPSTKVCSGYYTDYM